MDQQNAKTQGPPFVDSVLPVVEAKKADIVINDFVLGDHARILPTPGHTPGHVAFTFGRGKDDVVFAGDLMHTPLQTRYPELSPKFDVDPSVAATTRRNFLQRYCDTNTLCCTAHFPSPSAGKIRRGRWVFLRDGVVAADCFPSPLWVGEGGSHRRRCEPDEGVSIYPRRQPAPPSPSAMLRTAATLPTQGGRGAKKPL